MSNPYLQDSPLAAAGLAGGAWRGGSGGLSADLDGGVRSPMSSLDGSLALVGPGAAGGAGTGANAGGIGGGAGSAGEKRNPTP